jgi:signal transduction histidine kinase/CheY-like chemotaxis protein
MNNKSYKIDFEIYIVFIVVIGISLFNAIYSSINISKNQEVVNKIMTNEIPSQQKLEKMNLLVVRSKMFTTNWVYLPGNSQEKEKLKILHTIEYPEIKNSFLNLINAWDDKDEVIAMSRLFADFEKLIINQRQVMTLLDNFEDYEVPEKKFKAEEIIENYIHPKSSILISELNSMIISRKARADVMHEEMRSSSRKLMMNVLGIAILIVIVILIAVFYISNNIIVPTMKLKNNILQIEKGEMPEINIRHGNNAIGQMIEAVQALTSSLRQTAHFAHEIGYGNLTAEFQPSSDKDELGNALVQMRASLRNADEINKQRSWNSTCTEKINKALRENTDDIDKLSDSVISVLVKSLNGYQGGIYLLDERSEISDQNLLLHGSYSMDAKSQARTSINKGEGVIGQVMRDGELIYLKDLNDQTKSIQTALGTYYPTHVLIVPLRHHNNIYGAVEISAFNEFQQHEIDFVKNIGETIGSTISSVKANTLTKKLLSETRKQASRLSSQEEELRRTNDELSHQSQLLQASEEELKQSNLELKQKARELQQKNDINEQARQALSIKAKELELNSKYKSEFLANMSHELRTPLNSVLILAKLLEENKENNMNQKQTEYAGVIHKSGKDLLLLINDILDLSKIEAGKVELLPEETDINLVSSDIHSLFAEMANEKKINFVVENQASLPAKFISDKVRLEQIIKNLLSNAFKFTPQGGKIILRIKRPEKNVQFSNPNLFNRKNVIEFSVTDSGIGIPAEKQALIFEAFQQADGSTSRSYGGTGLGLSISKMLVSMLGGEMQLLSEQGKGSTFFVFLPVDYLTEKENLPDNNTVPNISIPPVKASIKTQTVQIHDDRNTLRENDKILLIVEDDINFANILLEMAHERNLKGIIACDGNVGLQYVEEFRPSAIIMDMQLPGMSGWSVLNKIKANAKLSHIPVHIMSAMDRQQVGIDMGATAYLRKPLDKRDLDDAFTSIDNSIENDLRHVLLIEDVKIHQEIVQNLLVSHHRNVEVKSVATTAAAFESLLMNKFDCIVLDLDLGKGPEEGFSFLQKIKNDKNYSDIPVIIFTASELDSETESKIKILSAKIVNKNSGSLDTLIEETELFLHNISIQENVSPGVPVYMADILKNKNILIVDDDMRNIYALSNALESQGMNVITAGNGKEAIEKLNINNQVDLILMDIMMPEMDGYQAMQEIKKSDKLRSIPIIALTAKAMVGDREKCLQCGAADYISKPINADQLYSLMRVWLYKENL